LCAEHYHFDSSLRTLGGSELQEFSGVRVVSISTFCQISESARIQHSYNAVELPKCNKEFSRHGDEIQQGKSQRGGENIK
jgi:hypothetical protein